MVWLSYMKMQAGVYFTESVKSTVRISTWWKVYLAFLYAFLTMAYFYHIEEYYYYAIVAFFGVLFMTIYMSINSGKHIAWQRRIENDKKNIQDSSRPDDELPDGSNA